LASRRPLRDGTIPAGYVSTIGDRLGPAYLQGAAYDNYTVT